jgi:hypothetical protein
MSLLRDEVAVVSAWRSKQKKKMKSVKQAINKILWDEGLKAKIG